MQTVNQSRQEYSSPQNQRRASGLDERVLPNLKASIRTADAEARQRAKYKAVAAARSKDLRRSSRSNGLRSFWQTVWRNGDPVRLIQTSPVAQDLPVSPVASNLATRNSGVWLGEEALLTKASLAGG